MANEIEVFRDDFIRDVLEIADQANEHPTNAFIERVIQRFGNELGMPTEIDYCYVDRPKQGKFKRMRLDAGTYDPTTFEADLFLADFNEGPCQSVGKEDVLDRVKSLINFYANACNGCYPPEASGPEADLANKLKRNRDALNRLRLFIFTTNQISNRLKEFNLPPYEIDGTELKVKLEIVDIERLFNNLQGPEEFTINTSDFGCKPIPCVKADNATDDSADDGRNRRDAGGVVDDNRPRRRAVVVMDVMTGRRRRRAVVMTRRRTAASVMRRGNRRARGKGEARNENHDCLDDLVHITPATFCFAVPQGPVPRLHKARALQRRFLTKFIRN